MSQVVVELNQALIGRYLVEREIGQGGMASVYLARDVRHDRRVAIKVLHPELGAVLGPERFVTEMKVTANLQHPHILPLFDSGTACGQLFYVMPFVDGETLRDRLTRERQLPVDDAVRIAADIADALEYAHQQGVVHRDIKPENILLAAGRPMVADFGIALAISNAGGARLTQTGLSLGTPQYMSPEQATGEQVIDARSDIYSLGALTYEMLTGEAPHSGPTAQAVIARVLTEPVRSVRGLRPSVPAHVEAAVEHALEKLAADRFKSARAFQEAITGRVAITPRRGAVDPTAPRKGSRRRVLAIAATIVLVWAASLVVAMRWTHAIGETRQYRFAVQTPPSRLSSHFAISPDGQWLAFVADDSTGAESLWLRRLDEVDAHPIAGTANASFPFWSPDSRSIGFSANGEVRTIPVAGGTATVVCRCGAFGASWGSAGTILLGSSSGGLKLVSAAGGRPDTLVRRDTAEKALEFPVFLPDGRHFVYTAWSDDVRARGIYLGTTDGRPPVRLVSVGSRAIYAPPGYLLYVRDSTLYAAALDVKGARLTGQPVILARQVSYGSGNGFVAMTVADDGTLAYRPQSDKGAKLQWWSPDGRIAETGASQEDYLSAALSPDDRRVALVRRRPAADHADVWILDLSTRIQSQLTSDTSLLSAPRWMARGQAVAFSRSSSGTTTSDDIVRQAPGDRGATLLTRQPACAKILTDVAPDDAHFAYTCHGLLFVAPVTPDGSGATPTDSMPGENGRISPDGRAIVFDARQAGRRELFVADFPSLAHPVQLSAAGGDAAAWGRDGHAVYYLSPGDTMMMVSVDRTAGAIHVGATRALFHAPTWLTADRYSVARDGRFLMIVEGWQVSNVAPPILVTSNWWRALDRTSLHGP